MDLRSDNKISQDSNIYGDNLLAVIPNLNVNGLLEGVIRCYENGSSALVFYQSAHELQGITAFSLGFPNC